LTKSKKTKTNTIGKAAKKLSLLFLFMTSSCASVGEAAAGAIIEGTLDLALESAFEAGKAITSGGNQKTPAEPDDPFCSKDVFFIAPVDGLVTKNQDVYFEFGEYNISINPAGELPPKNEHSCYVSGHHHLIINEAYEPTSNGSIPFKENVYHFGGGQKTTTIRLNPGKYSLQLVLGDYTHTPISIGMSEDNFIVSEKIFIEVKD
jgi:hypothetical protein